MNTNAVADALKILLIAKHPRVYRNAPISNPTFPYVVFNVENITESFPSEDYYVYVDVFDAPTGSVRQMETIADDIQSIARTVYRNENLNMQIEKISRQFVPADDLTSSKMITMQFNCRVYFIWKEN